MFLHGKAEFTGKEARRWANGLAVEPRASTGEHDACSRTTKGRTQACSPEEAVVGCAFVGVGEVASRLGVLVQAVQGQSR